MRGVGSNLKSECSYLCIMHEVNDFCGCQLIRTGKYKRTVNCLLSYLPYVTKQYRTHQLSFLSSPLSSSFLLSKETRFQKELHRFNPVQFLQIKPKYLYPSKSYKISAAIAAQNNKLTRIIAILGGSRTYCGQIGSGGCGKEEAEDGRGWLQKKRTCKTVSVISV